MGATSGGPEEALLEALESYERYRAVGVQANETPNPEIQPRSRLPFPETRIKEAIVILLKGYSEGHGEFLRQNGVQDSNELLYAYAGLAKYVEDSVAEFVWRVYPDNPLHELEEEREAVGRATDEELDLAWAHIDECHERHAVLLEEARMLSPGG